MGSGRFSPNDRSTASASGDLPLWKNEKGHDLRNAGMAEQVFTATAIRQTQEQNGTTYSQEHRKLLYPNVHTKPSSIQEVETAQSSRV